MVAHDFGGPVAFAVASNRGGVSSDIDSVDQGRFEDKIKIASLSVINGPHPNVHWNLINSTAVTL